MKYKIEKKVKEHKRKVRKAERQAGPGPAARKAKEGTAIPSKWPFKEQLLQEIDRAKEAMAAQQEARKAQRQKDREKSKRQGQKKKTMADLVDDASKRTESFEKSAKKRKAEDGTQNEHMDPLGQQSRRAFLRELRKVVEHADVVLHVLDARDPLGSRARQVEEMVLKHASKRLVYVLNKVDLVPREAVADWLRYLRRQQPTVAFKCATQTEGGQHLAVRKGKAEDASAEALKKSGSVGADTLLQLLKNYSRLEGGVKKSLSVGVVGYPNVGKSSLINSLKRQKSVGVSAVAGFTRNMQEVALDKHVRLLDSPGIVFDDSDAQEVLLRNCVDPDALADPLPAVQALLERTPAPALMQLYAIPAWDPADAPRSFLAHAARKKGKLLRGGVPDYAAAAKAVLKDWNSGKVPYYTPVPKELSSEGQVGDAQIVGAFSEEFSVENMMESDNKILDALEDAGQTSYVKIEARENTSQIFGAGDDMADDSEDDGPGSVGQVKRKVAINMNELEGKKTTGAKEDTESMEGIAVASSSVPKPFDGSSANELNPQINKNKKKALKAQKKKYKKAQKSKLDDSMEEEDEPYNFDKDFYQKKDEEDLSSDEDL